MSREAEWAAQDEAVVDEAPSDAVIATEQERILEDDEQVEQDDMATRLRREGEYTEEQVKIRRSYFEKLPPGVDRPTFDAHTHLKAVAHLVQFTDAHFTVDANDPTRARISSPATSRPGSPGGKVRDYEWEKSSRYSTDAEESAAEEEVHVDEIRFRDSDDHHTASQTREKHVSPTDVYRKRGDNRNRRAVQRSTITRA